MARLICAGFSGKKAVLGSLGEVEFDQDGAAEVPDVEAAGFAALPGFRLEATATVRAPKIVEAQAGQLPAFDKELMSKNWLEAYGKEVFEVDLDKRKGARGMYETLVELEAAKISPAE